MHTKKYSDELLSPQTIASLMVQVEGLRGAIDHTNQNIKSTKVSIDNMDKQIKWFFGVALSGFLALVTLGGYFVEHLDKRIADTQQIIQKIKGE